MGVRGRTRVRPAPVRLLSRRSEGSPYWNEQTETMPRERLNRLHLQRLRALLRYAYDRVPLYHDLYSRAGVAPGDIRSLDDFDRYVPCIDKHDLLAAQQLGPPWGDASALDEEFLAYRYQTSGSTGTPLGIPVTRLSELHYGQQWTYAFWAAGLRPADTFYFAFPWGMYIGFWSAYWGVRLLGATVVSGGGVNTETRIRQILQLKPSVLVCTPTYALYMAEVAGRMGVDLRAASVRVTFHAGEVGVGIASTRRAIEEAWGARAYELYGVGEVGSIAPGCPLRLGCHLAEDQSYATVLGPDGRPAAPGEVGENVVTSYIQYAQPVIKYRTHDLVRPDYGRCDCGRTWLLYRGGVLGRSDDMVTVKGTNVYPAGVEALVGRVVGSSPHYEVHVHPDGTSERVAVRLEAAQDVAESGYEDLGRRVEIVLRENIGVRIPVEVCPPGTLPRYEQKAKRFFDHRPPRGGGPAPDAGAEGRGGQPAAGAAQRPGGRAGHPGRSA